MDLLLILLVIVAFVLGWTYFRDGDSEGGEGINHYDDDSDGCGGDDGGDCGDGDGGGD